MLIGNAREYFTQETTEKEDCCVVGLSLWLGYYPDAHPS